VATRIVAAVLRSERERGILEKTFDPQTPTRFRRVDAGLIHAACSGKVAEEQAIIEPK
jgi:hypothetical protein